MYGQFKRFLSKTFLAGLSSTLALLTFSSALQAQEGDVEEVVVTGFRGSLEAALDNKRESANSIESIVAEDIGKMPDLNLAESIQRVPGVAITREGGEGRNVTVRGLDPDFTRVTLNGMEVPGSAGGLDSSGGVNRARSIDFNIFASELFNRIDIHKSQRASVEEGGLAATVDLQTAKPFDNPGIHLSAGAQVTVDNLAEENDPRVTALFSGTFFDDTFGMLLSVAQSERTVRQEGFGTVRYSAPHIDSSDAWDDTSATIVNGTPNAEANSIEYDPSNPDPEFSDPLNFMFMPRLPRMDYFSNTVDRTGITAAFQFRPIENLELGIDYVQSELENDRISYNYFAQFRNVWETITPIELTLDPSGRYITAGSFTGVRTRSESRGQFSTTDFDQTVFSAKYDISDNMRLDLMVGEANSVHDEEQYRFNVDSLPGGSSFSFDLIENPNVASMTYGFDITDPANHVIAGGTVVQKDIIDRTNETVKLDLTIEGETLDINAGFISNTREVDSLRFVATPGTLTAPANNTPVTDFPGLAITFEQAVGGGFASAIDKPAGFPTNWVVEDFDVARELYNAGSFEPARPNAATWNVEEETTGFYGEVNYEMDLSGMPLRLNAGARYVETETTALSFADVDPGADVDLQEVISENSYDDVLPSLNALLEITDELQARLGWSQNIGRPGLASLVPAITAITVINGNISTGNPDLDPISSDSLDIGLEWYFDEEALLGVTFFQKKLEGFIAGVTTQGILDPGIAAVVALRPEYDPADPLFVAGARDPFTDSWNLTTPVNAVDADLDGYEIAYQQPFTFLPGFWANFGIIANLTHVESTGDFPVTVSGVTELVTSDLPGLSENSSNYTIYYETETWGARLSVNSRDDYITGITGSNGNAREYNTGPTRMDASAFYNVTDNITIRLEVINLDEEPERNYTSGPLDGGLNLVREYNSTGREVFLGLTADIF